MKYNDNVGNHCGDQKVTESKVDQCKKCDFQKLQCWNEGKYFLFIYDYSADYETFVQAFY